MEASLREAAELARREVAVEASLREAAEAAELARREAVGVSLPDRMVFQAKAASLLRLP
ncbi:hypothetical protein [Nitratifractor sp.]